MLSVFLAIDVVGVFGLHVHHEPCIYFPDRDCMLASSAQIRLFKFLFEGIGVSFCVVVLLRQFSDV